MRDTFGRLTKTRLERASERRREEKEEEPWNRHCNDEEIANQSNVCVGGRRLRCDGNERCVDGNKRLAR
jgi:hypothetical protein